MRKDLAYVVIESHRTCGYKGNNLSRDRRRLDKRLVREGLQDEASGETSATLYGSTVQRSMGAPVRGKSFGNRKESTDRLGAVSGLLRKISRRGESWSAAKAEIKKLLGKSYAHAHVLGHVNDFVLAAGNRDVVVTKDGRVMVANGFDPQPIEHSNRFGFSCFYERDDRIYPCTRAPGLPKPTTSVARWRADTDAKIRQVNGSPLTYSQMRRFYRACAKEGGSWFRYAQPSSDINKIIEIARSHKTRYLVKTSPNAEWQKLTPRSESRERIEKLTEKKKPVQHGPPNVVVLRHYLSARRENKIIVNIIAPGATVEIPGIGVKTLHPAGVVAAPSIRKKQVWCRAQLDVFDSKLGKYRTVYTTLVGDLDWKTPTMRVSTLYDVQWFFADRE